MNPESARPPALARALLRLLLPKDERDFILGDLTESFQRRRDSHGAIRAALWFWSQLLRSIWPLLTLSPSKWKELFMIGWFRDFQSGLRQLRRAPGFSFTVLLTVAIGVGGATAVFSVLKGVVLSPLDFPDSERVVTLWGQTPEYPRAPLTVGDFNALAEGVTHFQHTAAEWGNTGLLLGEGAAEQVRVGWVTSNYMEMLGVTTQIGRLLRPEDVAAVVLSNGFWTRRFGSDPSVIGRSVQIDGTSMEIVGVLQPGDDPNLTTFSGGAASNELWRLMPPGWIQGEDRSVGWLRASARLRPSVEVSEAQAEVDVLMDQVNASITERDGGTDLRVNVVSARKDLVSEVSDTLWVLFAAVFGVLLIAATNVANLLFVRAHHRSGEVALRAALGGGRARLIRQLVMESSVLALLGGVLGMGAAWAGIETLLAIAPPTTPRLDQVQLDTSVLVFGLAVTGLAALVAGLAPAIWGTKGSLSKILGERRGTPSQGVRRLSQTLVVSQVALSLGLLMGTGLLLRSFLGLADTPLGFDTENVLTFTMETADPGTTPEEANAILEQYVDRLAEVPGVFAVGVTNRIPLAGGLYTGTYRSSEMAAANEDVVEASFRYITPGYLEAMRAEFRAGRGFTRDDGLASVLIDAGAAERLWPGENAVGRAIEYTGIGADPVLATVVGVVEPMKHGSVSDAAPQTVFIPMLATAQNQAIRYVAAHVDGDPDTYVASFRNALASVNPNTVLARPRSMGTLFDGSVAATRFASVLLGVFGIIALILAAVGIHGVMAFAIQQRTREFGIRVALGARHRGILHRVIGSGALLVGLGSVLGIGLSLALGRWLQSLLYRVEPTDLVSLGAATVLMIAVGLLGAYLPARRVLAVDPVRTLKDE